MATYYVIPQVAGASDSNNGTATSTPWLTIQKAATTMVAGDSVYIAGNWTYKELVTPAASGTSGNQISFIADVTGEHTGYGGIALISSVDDPNDNAVTRSYCWNQNGKEFITIRGFTMFATSSCIYDNQLAGNRAYEGVIIEDCALQAQGTYSIDLDLNAGANPTGNGLTIRRCIVSVIVIRHDGNATAHRNVKILIENVDVYRYLSASTLSSCILFSLTTGSTYSIGGVTIANCTVRGATYGVIFEGFKNTTNVSLVASCRIYATTAIVYSSGGVTAAVQVYSCMGSSVISSATEGDQFTTSRLSDIFGGFADFPLLRSLGWSPYQPGEPISIEGFISGSLAYGSSEAHLPTEDMYGNPRGMGRPNYWSKFYFDASDDAVSDPNAVWASGANVFDSSIITLASISTVGSSSGYYIFAGGTNAPASGDTIVGVYVRVRASASVSRTIHCEIYTDGQLETLASITEALGSDVRYTGWTLISAPSTGWDWAKLDALEVKAWMESGGSGSLSLYGIQLAVSTSAGHNDIGAVEARAQPTVQSTVTHYESYAAKFAGAGFQQDFAAVSAGIQTTISIWARWDSNYSGSKPRLQVRNIPGVADQEAVATGSANTWEQLSVTFIPTADAYVLVRYESRDASVSGLCYFADETVAI